MIEITFNFVGTIFAKFTRFRMIEFAQRVWTMRIETAKRWQRIGTDFLVVRYRNDLGCCKRLRDRGYIVEIGGDRLGGNRLTYTRVVRPRRQACEKSCSPVSNRSNRIYTSDGCRGMCRQICKVERPCKVLSDERIHSDRPCYMLDSTCIGPSTWSLTRQPLQCSILQKLSFIRIWFGISCLGCMRRWCTYVVANCHICWPMWWMF